ncbi:UNVERIFIED_CONTAM: hypothetical protein FKN15_002694 [Acipenser sinensis]
MPTPDPQEVGTSTSGPRGEPHPSPAIEGEPHQSPATEGELHQSPVTEGDQHQSPVIEGEPHQSPATDSFALLPCFNFTISLQHLRHGETRAMRHVRMLGV